MRYLISIKSKLNKLSVKMVLIVVTVFFFGFSTSAFAMSIIPSNFFDFSFFKKAEAPVVMNNSAGYIDHSVNNKVEVCKDVTCTNPKPGIIDFGTSPNNSPLIIDSIKGISGEVSGGVLGVINFQPPYGGVYFANPVTGLLKGTAWSETSGSINFSVTGQKVIIDPKTGEWSGWAWASGPYGGWIKFDCNTGSCVKTTWRYTNIKNSQEATAAANTSSSVTVATSITVKPKINSPALGNTIIKEVLKMKDIIVNPFKGIYSDTLNSFTKMGKVITNIYNSTVKSISNMKIKVPNLQRTNK